MSEMVENKSRGPPQLLRRCTAWGSPARGRCSGARRTGDELALVGVQHDGVDRAAAGVLALAPRGAQVPDLDRAVLAPAVHPLAVLLEAHLGAQFPVLSGQVLAARGATLHPLAVTLAAHQVAVSPHMLPSLTR